MTDARERIALRIEETRALLPHLSGGSTLLAALIEGRIGAYETALADIEAWLAEPEEEIVVDAPEEATAAPEAEPEPEPEAIAKIAAATAAPPRAAGAVWTEERIALLAREWEAGTAPGDIFDAVCRLPGPPPSSKNAIAVQVAYLRSKGMTLRRPGAPPAPPQPFTDEEIADARRIIAAGGGAKAIAADFGWPLDRAQDLAELARAQAKAA